jgi:hypothetical protein
MHLGSEMTLVARGVDFHAELDRATPSMAAMLTSDAYRRLPYETRAVQTS